MIALRGTGRYHTGEKDVVFGSRIVKPSVQRPCLWFLGQGSTADTVAPVGSTSQTTLANANYLSLNADWSSASHWGNSTSRARAAEGKTYIQDSAPITAADGPVYLLGNSMGACLAMNYALANPDDVVAIAGVQPLVNLLDFYAEDRGGYAASINSAYGGAPTADDDPLSRADELADAGIRIRLWYGDADTLTTPADMAAFTAACSTASKVSVGNVGHGFVSPAMSDIVDFFAEADIETGYGDGTYGSGTYGDPTA